MFLISGFEWLVNLEWIFEYWLLASLLTVWIFRSLWRATFVMYQGAPVKSLSVMDWKAWIGRIFAGLAGPQIWMPYDQIGLIITLYSSSLFLRLKLDFSRGLSRWRRELSCLRFCLVWLDQVSLLSRVMPKYLVDWLSGICLLLNFSGGQSNFFRDKFTWEELLSLILIFQFLAQDSILFKCSCKCWDAKNSSEHIYTPLLR